MFGFGATRAAGTSMILVLPMLPFRFLLNPDATSSGNKESSPELSIGPASSYVPGARQPVREQPGARQPVRE